MSTSRLTFLYPPLFRTFRRGDPIAQTAANRCRPTPKRSARQTLSFSSAHPHRQAAFKRHGKAVEPQADTPSEEPKLPTPPQEEALPPPKPSSEPKVAGEPKKVPEDAKSLQSTSEKSSSGVQNDVDSPPKTKPEAESSSDAKPSEQDSADYKMKESGPMEAVLHMPPPESSSHPHITPPPYIHHFDSYTLVKQLESGGYSRDQAITTMKGVRSLLSHHLDVAQEGLVSKSDVDNETYLFRAACSELSSEVKNNRKSADEEIRQQRTQLQHEFDILNQRMGQDLQTVKEEVRAMFNERKLTVREEQRSMESAIHQVNLKISVMLSGDARSDIEGLRWVLIRRSVLGIIFMAVMTLATLRLATYQTNERKREAEEKARHEENLKQNGGKEDHAAPIDAAQILAAN